jgi:hypothetical protein
MKWSLYTSEEHCFLHGSHDATISYGVFYAVHAENLLEGSFTVEGWDVKRQPSCVTYWDSVYNFLQKDVSVEKFAENFWDKVWRQSGNPKESHVQSIGEEWADWEDFMHVPSKFKVYRSVICYCYVSIQ